VFNQGVEQTVAVRPLELAPFRSGSPEDRAAVAMALDAACRDSGFFTVADHGIPLARCREVLDAFGAFFDLPPDEKSRAVVADEGANRGYSELGKEALAYSRGFRTPPDLFEAFNVGNDDSTGPYFDTHRRFFAPNVWPERPAGLGEAWRAYEEAVAELAGVILEVMAVALDLDGDWFTQRCRHAVVTTRALNYARAHGAPPPDPDQMRLGAHTDYGIMTILLADAVPGLQVHTRGDWHDVVAEEGTLVCNIGDMLERWTNDRWTSTLHRVVPPSETAVGPLRRRSIARFLDCEPDRVVSCLPSCCGPDDPPRYQPVVAGDWLRAKILGGRTRAVTDVDRRRR
jgi:isopenicillin N synthase-like dioxygenase